MIHEVKKFQVIIAGEQYSLLSDESEHHIMKISSLVDSTVKEILQKANAADAKKAVVLAALQLANKIVSLEKTIDQQQSCLETMIGHIDYTIKNS